MKKRFLVVFFLVFWFACSLCAQNNRTIISGDIISEVLSIVNIHVLNLATNIGVITNIDGKFEIEVQESDTLFFSGIQFQEEKIIITKNILKLSKISLQLKESSYAMDEVLLRKKITGDLTYDSKRNKQKEEHITPYALDFSAKNFDDSRTLIDQDSRMTTSEDTNVGGGRGSGLFYIASLLVRPITKPIGEMIRKRSKKKENMVLYNESIKEAVDTGIRDALGDHFFTNDLNIPKDQINLFIEFCTSKNIGVLFVEKKELQLIDVFINQSSAYKKGNHL